MMGEEKRGDDEWLVSGGGGSPRPYQANGGYPSPTMSSNQDSNPYDPYSPNSKLGELKKLHLFSIKLP